MTLKPMRPIPRGCRAGFFRGRYKVEPEDFFVEEVPAYMPSGDGPHLWVWVEKRGLSTIDMLKNLGQQLNRDQKQFGVAGLKDSRSVSRQWISIERGEERALEQIDDDRMKILDVSRHGNKLRLGHLRGNRFVILLRDTVEGDLERARENLAEMAATGVPNYFGEQRFGKRGSNLQKGLEVLAGDARSAARRMPRRVFGLMLSAVQSEVFNRTIAARIQSLGKLMRGDLAQLHRNGACFAVEDLAAEQARCDAMEVSPSGPMPGPKMTQPTGEPREIERTALQDVGLQEDAFDGLPFGLASGERRPLRMPVTDAGADAVEGGTELRFTLPKGGYATSVLRELLSDTIWFGGPGDRGGFRRRRGGRGDSGERGDR
ncbi:MAG: tRNA pseudouridine(13) synthase TruD [Planctomycetota bacterium]